MLRRLIQDEDGQSLVEYGLILGLVSVVMVAALSNLRESLQTVFNEIGVKFQMAQQKSAAKKH
jgi:pilus assembly protein Flp/PilA